MEDAFKSKILAEYYGCGNDKKVEKISVQNTRNTAAVLVTRSHSMTVTQQEENHIKRTQSENRPRKAPIALALAEGNYRIHLKLSLLKGVISTTLLTVISNPPPTFLDHLLTSDRSQISEYSHKNDNRKLNSTNSGVSNRLVLVSTNFCKESLATFCPNKNKYVPNGTSEAEKRSGNFISNIPAEMIISVTDIAQKGFIYHGHRFQFLLSKDPKDKISYFFQDDCSDRIFPDASSLRNYIADFSSQPSIFRAG